MIELNRIKWSLYHGVLLPDAPPHQDVALSVDEQKHLLKQSGAYFLRWTSNWDCGQPTEFWYVIKDRPSRMEDYLSNTRRYTKRGLRLFGVEKVDGEAIAHEAYSVYLQAFSRYGNQIKPEPPEALVRELSYAGADTDVWAAYKGRTMVAYAVNQRREKMCEYGVMKYHPDYLKEASAFALIHTMNEYYLEKLRLQYVADGSRSLFHETKIQDFLAEHFGFRKAFCRLHLAYAPRTQLAVRALFPLRRQIYRCKLNWLRRLAALLKHEEIRRSFDES